MITVSSVPLVRERSTVQSCPAAPAFQGLSVEIGRDKDSAAPAETPKDRPEPCKIRGAASEAVILRGAAKLALLTLQTAARSPSPATKALLIDDAIQGLRIGLAMASEEAAHG